MKGAPCQTKILRPVTAPPLNAQTSAFYADRLRYNGNVVTRECALEVETTPFFTNSLNVPGCFGERFLCLQHVLPVRCRPFEDAAEMGLQ